MTQKKTTRKNDTGGQSIRYGGTNPIPKSAKDINTVYDEAKEGSAFYKKEG